MINITSRVDLAISSIYKQDVLIREEAPKFLRYRSKILHM